MAKTPRSTTKKSTVRNSRTTVSGPAAPDASGHGDVLAEKLAGTQDLAAAFPFNANKAAEYDPDAALAPPEGATAKPGDPIVGASTVTERNGNPTRWGSGAADRRRTRRWRRSTACASTPTGRVLTTNQGVPVGDNQNSLKAGLRGPTLLEDFILREKITHFDHERIPERIVHARGSAAHGYFECTQAADRLHACLAVRRGRQADAGVRALLDGARRARLDRHGARRARLRRQVLHRRRQLGPGRQQHAGVLHPGRDEVSRPGARRQAGAAPRDAAGGDRRTTRSGTSSR